MNTVEKIFNKINLQLTPKHAKQINTSYLFNIGEDNTEQWLLDLTKTTNWITKTNTEQEAECIITIKNINDFNDLANGKINPTIAFMQGKIKIKGNVSLALKLQILFT